MNASPETQAYFASMERQCFAELEIAQRARAQHYDPANTVEITLAKDMAERVIGLMSVIAPQLKGAGAEQRIIELEKQYGILDWRVALKIAEEVAKQKFCKFKDEREAMETGIRTGFTYVTLGVVSSPLEGFTGLDIKDRRDGKGKYFCLNYSGPIRNAGGTAAAVSVIIGDYIRTIFGYAAYDPTEQEVKRCHAELTDYHEWITNLQYFPSEKECEFLLTNIPVEIGGDPSEKYEVGNIALKDIPRIATNKLRSGYCLIHSSCIPLKAPKLWKQISLWRADFGMEHWTFLEEFIKIQKSMKAQSKKAIQDKLAPDYTYVHDLVAGRPVFGHPSRPGGFRLRYGRARTSGFSAQCVHPATMAIMNDYLATATQLKVERPGKAAAFSVCDTIRGPFVRLKNGDCKRLNDEKEAKKIKSQIVEIICNGDILINYGDFLNRAHALIPAGYCEEYWALELEEAIIARFGSLDFEETALITDIPVRVLREIIAKPLTTSISAENAITLSKILGVALHPAHTYTWKDISKEQLQELLNWLKSGKILLDEGRKKLILPESPFKRQLEIIQCPHLNVQNEYVVIEHESFLPLEAQLPFQLVTNDKLLSENAISCIQEVSLVQIKDVAGVCVGARMGRPEKAKMRKMIGNPHCIFPVGEQGGKLRSFQTALQTGFVEADFRLFWCPKCNNETAFSRCHKCDTITEKRNNCDRCGIVKECPHEPKTWKPMKIDVKAYFDYSLKKTKSTIHPDLIKGVRGTISDNHNPEHLAKGILRAKHNLAVNKDGTVRYDISEVTMTHFKPREVGTSVEKLKKLGYTHDAKGNILEHEDQVLELKSQDVVLPSCPDSPDETCEDVLLRTSIFMDELLNTLYGEKAYYNAQTKDDLIGHLIIGLAPHTSAGILGRIVGFSKTQSFFAHPLYHAAMRRDCDGDESCVILLLDALINFSKEYLPSSRGSTMDAPLVLTYVLAPAEVDDMAFDVDRVWKYPLEFYRASEQFKMPWEIKIQKIGDVLNTPQQYEGMGYTHDTTDINAGTLCSAYKLLPSMQEKLAGQMDLAEKIRATTPAEVAALVIEKHFIRDIKGNLRKFSQQEFRCVSCNEKFRRPPILGACTKCKGKIIFTISEGSVVKYMEPSTSLARKYSLSPYLRQTLELTQQRIEDVFGKDKEKQLGLGAWFG